ncbi:MAG: phospholipid/cholesterol/gamma-HCH transport system permease protein [Gammaproteobacteria bacterium]|jgi:phospholipid/cholesterol/gamma-HCH transport system permease protein|nr:phospholipid/cholesterol/gamma-HCH transport system permease protein [Gammaproteobacteria bacterium]
MLVEVRRSEQGLDIELTGEWRALELAQIDAALAGVDLANARHISIGTQSLTALDLSGAWRLREFLQRARNSGAQVEFRGATPDQLRLIDATSKGECPVPVVHAHEHGIAPLTELGLAEIGLYSVREWRDLMAALAFLGRIFATLGRAFTSLKRLRPISIARHIYDTGITAMPITALIAFLISVIIAYMSAQQLRRFGAEIFVVDLVTIGVLREMGVLLTSIVVAGRSGSAFAAELGSMKLNEEVDALVAMGVDPFEALILPRLIGLMIALPLLTIVADIVGLMGGALLCRYLLDIPITQYLTRVNEAITPTTFWVGLMKAPVFAMLIGMAGAYRGMQVRDSSRELGRLTTVAVVQSIFLVILADALFAVLFMELGV